MPWRLSALTQVATVPGTPAERPLKRAELKSSGASFSKNERGPIAAGAASRPSMVVTRPFGVRTSMNPPPPIPAENGSVTPSTPAAAIAASTALPPRRSVLIAAFVAKRSTVAAAPPGPRARCSITRLTSRRICAGSACLRAYPERHQRNASEQPPTTTGARILLALCHPLTVPPDARLFRRFLASGEGRGAEKSG